MAENNGNPKEPKVSPSPSTSSLPLDFSLQTSTERSTHVSSLLQNLDASSLSPAQLNLL